MKKKAATRGIIAAIMLLVLLQAGCNSTRKITNSQGTTAQITVDKQEQTKQERTITRTDTTRTDTGRTERIIIEFREPAGEPADPPPAPIPGADNNYYNYLLYRDLIGRIKSVEQYMTGVTSTQQGLTTTDSTNSSTNTSEETEKVTSDTTESSSSEPIAITPAWVKSVRTAGLLLLIAAAILLFIRYSGILRRIFQR